MARTSEEVHERERQCNERNSLQLNSHSCGEQRPPVCHNATTNDCLINDNFTKVVEKYVDAC